MQSEKDKIRIVIADDHEILASGIAVMLSKHDEFEIIGFISYNDFSCWCFQYFNWCFYIVTFWELHPQILADRSVGCFGIKSCFKVTFFDP